MGNAYFSRRVPSLIEPLARRLNLTGEETGTAVLLLGNKQRRERLLVSPWEIHGHTRSARIYPYHHLRIFLGALRRNGFDMASDGFLNSFSRVTLNSFRKFITGLEVESAGSEELYQGEKKYIENIKTRLNEALNKPDS